MKHIAVRLQWAPDDVVVVGTLAEAERGRVYFEYDESFVAHGVDISPIKLALQSGLIEHVDRGFGPLFGVFDDSLPDGWACC